MAGRADCLRLLELYPRVFFACHRRHVRDPKTRARVSARQASILDHLDDVEGTAVSDLARHLGVTPSTMSLSIDRLEARGYVRRRRDRHDQRRVLVLLTRAGRRITEAQSVLDPERVRQLLDHLASDDRARALEGLALLADAAVRLGQHPTADRRAHGRPSRPR